MANNDLAELAALQQINAPRQQQRADREAMAMRMQLAQMDSQDQQARLAASVTSDQNRNETNMISDLSQRFTPEQLAVMFKDHPVYGPLFANLHQADVKQRMQDIVMPALQGAYDKNKNNPEALSRAVDTFYKNPAALGGREALDAAPWGELNAALPTRTTPSPLPTIQGPVDVAAYLNTKQLQIKQANDIRAAQIKHAADIDAAYKLLIEKDPSSALPADTLGGSY